MTRFVLAICLVLASTLASEAYVGSPLRILFDNESSLTITTLQIESAGAKDWGEQRLPKAGLAAHSKAVIMLVGGADKCVVQMKFATSDGQTHSLIVNLCGNSTFVFHGQM